MGRYESCQKHAAYELRNDSKQEKTYKNLKNYNKKPLFFGQRSFKPPPEACKQLLAFCGAQWSAELNVTLEPHRTSGLTGHIPSHPAEILDY